MFDQTRPDSYDSSFFHTSYSGKKVLVLVPHQDDEINVGANSIQNFLHAGADVYVMFANSGDYYSWYSFDVRMTEAVNSLAVLGLDRSHIFILGYGETLNGAESGHIFYTTDNVLKSPRGHTETYGAAGLQEFGYIAHGVHSTYCSNSYRKDLKELILQVKADIIIATDFDLHADHRMLSLSFDKVMGEILSRSDNDYFPEVFRKFAYCTSWLNDLDLFDEAKFILSTAKPKPRITPSYDKQIIDTSYYSWNERTRFPVPEPSRKQLAENITNLALLQHVSQTAYVQAGRVINGDDVSWRRRTDSLSFKAHVKATSSIPEMANDFRLLNVADVDSDAPDWVNYLWIPDETDNVKELVFTWDAEQTISRVVLWGNVDGVPLEKVSVSMNTGWTAEIGSLPENGLPYVMDIPEQKAVTECRIKVISQGSAGAGLAEVEFFAQREQKPVVQPFIQITTGGNFVYEYLRTPDEMSIPIECYMYRTDSEVNYEVIGPAHLENGILSFEGSSKDTVILKAYTDDGMFCRSVFRTVSHEEISRINSRHKRDRRRLEFAHFIALNKLRIRVYSGLLVKKGPITMLKILAGKIVKKIKKKLRRK